MNKILKTQAFIFLLLSLIALITTGKVLSIFAPLLGVFIAFWIMPIMLFSYNWGSEIFISAFIIFLFTISLMIYGYKQRETNVGIITFLVGFWIYVLSSTMFLGTHF